MVVHPLPGLSVQRKPAGGGVSGHVCTMGAHLRTYNPSHIHSRSLCLGPLQHTLLLLLHGVGQPESVPPLVRLSAGPPVLPKQLFSGERCEGASDKLHAAGQLGHPLSVGVGRPPVW